MLAGGCSISTHAHCGSCAQRGHHGPTSRAGHVEMVDQALWTSVWTICEYASSTIDTEITPLRLWSFHHVFDSWYRTVMHSGCEFVSVRQLRRTVVPGRHKSWPSMPPAPPHSVAQYYNHYNNVMPSACQFSQLHPLNQANAAAEINAAHSWESEWKEKRAPSWLTVAYLPPMSIPAFRSLTGILQLIWVCAGEICVSMFVASGHITAPEQCFTAMTPAIARWRWLFAPRAGGCYPFLLL